MSDTWSVFQEITTYRLYFLLYGYVLQKIKSFALQMVEKSEENFFCVINRNFHISSYVGVTLIQRTDLM